METDQLRLEGSGKSELEGGASTSEFRYENSLSGDGNSENTTNSAKRRLTMDNLHKTMKGAGKDMTGKNTVAASMMEITISKVIVGVLLMLFFISLIESSEMDRSYVMSLQQMHTTIGVMAAAGVSNKQASDTLAAQTQLYIQEQKSCIYLMVNGTVFLNEWSDYDHQRVQETSNYFIPEVSAESAALTPNEAPNVDVEAWFDEKVSPVAVMAQEPEWATQPSLEAPQPSFCFGSPCACVAHTFARQKIEDLNAVNSLKTTTFVICLLGGWMFLFHTHARKFANKISRPLRIIAKDMSKVSRLQFVSEKELNSSMVEIQYIQSAFFKMKNAISSFSKYVPREIVLNMTMHHKMARLGVVPKQISIFFSDIANFTTICEQLAPNEVLMMLSQYFTAMSNIIVRTKGILLEFIGDAILAIWNAPEDVEKHACACIEATLEMQSELVTLREQWTAMGYPEIHIRCGIHTDQVFVGNLGAPDRMKYGVMGDGVNLASRLEELNKRYGTKILISDKTYIGIEVQLRFYLRHVDRVVVKGRSKGTDLYEVVGFNGGVEEHQIKEEKKQFCKIYGEAMALYFERKFDEAYDVFDSAKNIVDEGVDDVSCMLLMDRCMTYKKDDPGEDWDGASVLTSK